MNKIVQKATLHGTVNVPPSKSYAHRYIVCAALADGTSHIHNVDFCQDVLATLDCISLLGAEYSVSGTTLTIKGCSGQVSSNTSVDPTVFKCRESATTLRYMIPISLSRENNVEFRGTGRIIERGIMAYECAFHYSDISYRPTKTKLCMSGVLKSGSYRINGSLSGQYVSGLLFALPLLKGDSRLTIIPPFGNSGYLDMTLEVLKTFGISIQRTSETTFYIKGNQCYTPCDVTIEGDWSNAAFFCAMNYLSENNDVHVQGLNDASLQDDKIIVDYLDAVSSGAAIINLSANPDLAPILFSVAAVRGGSTFTGTKALNSGSNHRAKAMKEELRKFGAKLDINPNSVVIHDMPLHAPTVALDGHGDHRIVMALSALLSVYGGEISDAEAVNKSYPGFFKEIERITK